MPCTIVSSLNPDTFVVEGPTHVHLQSTGASALVEVGGSVSVRKQGRVVLPDMNSRIYTVHPQSQVLRTEASGQVGAM